MVCSIWLTDHKDFNLFARLMRLKRSEIINTFQERGKILIIIDRDAKTASEWNSKKTKFLKEIQG